ncbi:hypothetical protein ES708_24957 [subsurface metagenome]
MSKKKKLDEGKPTEPQNGSQRLNLIFFLILLVGAALLVFFVARVFLLPILLAAIAAALFHPLYRRILKRVKQKSTLAAFISLVIFCLIILIPIAVLAYLVTGNVIEVTRLINRNIPQIRTWLQNIDSAISNLPFVEGQRISGLIDSTRVVGIIQQSLSSVSRATLKSTLLIGGIQGTIGAVLFFALGIPGSVLIGVLFLVLAAIPGLGPAVIWLPTTLILFALGNYLQAAIMLVIGGGLIPLVDYLLRPRLVGKDTQLHPLLVFIGVLGGVSLFGIWGLLFGPLAMSVAVTLLSIFKRVFNVELKEI